MNIHEYTTTMSPPPLEGMLKVHRRIVARTMNHNEWRRVENEQRQRHTSPVRRVAGRGVRVIHVPVSSQQLASRQRYVTRHV